MANRGMHGPADVSSQVPSGTFDAPVMRSRVRDSWVRTSPPPLSTGSSSSRMRSTRSSAWCTTFQSCDASNAGTPASSTAPAGSSGREDADGASASRAESNTLRPQFAVSASAAMSGPSPRTVVDVVPHPASSRTTVIAAAMSR